MKVFKIFIIAAVVFTAGLAIVVMVDFFNTTRAEVSKLNTPEESIDMFIDNSQTKTKVVSFSYDDVTFIIETDQDDNTHITLNSDKDNEVFDNLDISEFIGKTVEYYNIDGESKMCISGFCFVISQEQENYISQYVDIYEEQIQNIELLSLLFETLPDGTQRYDSKYVTLSLSNDGSILDIYINNLDIDINLSFKDENIIHN